MGDIPTPAITARMRPLSDWTIDAGNRPGLKARDLALLAAIWAYVTLSNLLFGLSMATSLATIGVTHVFSPWDARLLQHLLLFPALVGCAWLSRRIGWQPGWRAWPLQLLLGLAFAMLADPSLQLGDRLAGVPQSLMPPTIAPIEGPLDKQQLLFIAASTSLLLSYAFCLALLTGFDLYRRYRDSRLRTEALERALSSAHLAALRMQLSPHTLFNLLHTIRGNISWDPAAAQTMVVQLGDLLRRLLRQGEQELSRLQDELECARLYLDLQQHRFSDRLRFAMPERASLPSAWVPSLILHPLVENAVVHGMAHHTAPVSIRIEVESERDELVLRVFNTVAANATPAAAGTDGTSGIGLKNVAERLAIQFGERASLRTGVGASGQWLAQVRMPMLRVES